MKIHQLPLGARFLFEGQEYVKSGPMVGSGAGGQRLIPRHAQVQPLEGADTAAAPAPAPAVDRERLLAAFEAFYRTSRRLVPPEGALALDEARQEFLRAIG